MYMLAAYTIFQSQKAIGLSTWPINLGNGELGQTQFLERDGDRDENKFSKRMRGEA